MSKARGSGGSAVEPVGPPSPPARLASRPRHCTGTTWLALPTFPADP